jgi:hypothetical protein
MGGGDHVDEAGPLQHARWGDRIQPEHHEADHVGEQQHDAQWPVAVRVTPPQPPDEGEGHDEVGVVVKVGQQDSYQVVAAQPAIERTFDGDVEQALDVQDAAAVGQGGG